MPARKGCLCLLCQLVALTAKLFVFRQRALTLPCVQNCGFDDHSCLYCLPSMFTSTCLVHLCQSCCCLSLQEDSFHLVDNRPTMKTRGARRFQPRFMRRDVAQARGQEVAQPQQRTKGRQFKPWQMGRDQGRVSVCATHPRPS